MSWLTLTRDDADLDEGSVLGGDRRSPHFGAGEALWIVDLNRQSLDRIVPFRRRSAQLGSSVPTSRGSVERIPLDLSVSHPLGDGLRAGSVLWAEALVRRPSRFELLRGTQRRWIRRLRSLSR